MDTEKKLLKKLDKKEEVVVVPEIITLNSNDYAEIGAKTQADAFLYFLQRLDINRVSNVLEDARTYQNFEKPLFVEKLSNVFQEFIQAGDTV